MENRLSFLTSLLEQKKSGVSDEEIIKEYDKEYGEGSLEKILDPRKEGTKRFSENPLILLAEENGALKALLENRKRDLFGPDDSVKESRMKDELFRLKGIILHYQKIEELILPLLPDLSDEAKGEILSDQKTSLDDINEFSKARKRKDTSLRERIFPSLVSSLSINIDTENEYLLPLLDERLSPLRLCLLKEQRDRKGYFLLRYPSRKDS